MSRIRSTIMLAAALVVPSAISAQEQPVDLNAPDRRAAEVERDATSMPLEVNGWIGIQPGWSVADLSAGTGYHSWIFRQWVGPEGHVWSQSSYRPDTLKARIESGDLAAENVHYVAQITDLPDNQFDLVFTDRNYHDFPPDRIPEILAAIQQKLKPGGLFVVVDARADEGRDTEGHRIADQVIIDEVTAAGFELVETSEMLANPEDDRSGADFGGNRNALDRSLIKFQKPAAEGHEGMDHGAAGEGHEGHAEAGAHEGHAAP